MINLLNIANFYNVAGGYGYKEYGVLKKLYGDKYKYISTEANNRRIDKKEENICLFLMIGGLLIGMFLGLS